MLKNVLILLLFISTILAIQACGEETQITIFASADQKGYLLDCGCGSQKLGGLARRTTIVSDNQSRLDHLNALQLDAGGFSEFFTEDGFERTKVFFDIHDRMKMTAVNVSIRDLGREADLLMKLISSHEIPYISANIIDDKTGETALPSHLMLDLDEKKVFIIGITEKVSRKWRLENGRVLKTIDCREALKPLLTEANNSADIVILLAHKPRHKLKKLLPKLEGIDLVIAEDGYSMSRDAEMLGEAYLFFPGTKGQYLGNINITLNDKGIGTYDQALIPLAKEITEDSEIRGMIEAVAEKK